MILTVKQAAETAGVSPSLVYAWCNEGRLPHKRLGRRGKRGAIRIQPEDLEALLEECKGETGQALPSPFVLNHIVLN